MTEDAKKSAYVTSVITALVFLLCYFLVGCGHNISVHGVGMACPYGAIGYGSFSCVKDNVTIERTEEPVGNVIKTNNKFIVGKQTTGYDVELEKTKTAK